MHIEKIKYTAQYEAGRKVAEWIGLEVSPSFEQTGDETFKAAQEQVAKWYQQGNPENSLPGQQGPPVELPTINRAEERVEADQAFQQLKETLENIKYREEAQAYLDGTDFKHTIEAKKIVNKKPNKPVV